MSLKNRGDRIQLLAKAVHKHFTPVLAPSDRTLLEHMLYACCLEDAAYEVADEAFHRLQESFFDWNEVRVTTITELMEHLHNLPDPKAAAVRIKKNLQTVFETRYSFDLQDMIKMNQGKAIAELEKFAGMSRYVLSYVTQNALGGHAIPVSQTIMQVLLRTEVVTEPEAAKQHVPGLERSIAKSKGTAFSSCLHQMGVLLAASPKGKQTIVILKEAGANVSEKKLPKVKDEKSSTQKVPGSKQADGKQADKSEPAAEEHGLTESPGTGKKGAAGRKSTPNRKSSTESISGQPASKKSPPKSAPSKAVPPKSAAKPPPKTVKPKNTPEKPGQKKRKPK